MTLGPQIIKTCAIDSFANANWRTYIKIIINPIYSCLLHMDEVVIREWQLITDACMYWQWFHTHELHMVTHHISDYKFLNNVRFLPWDNFYWIVYIYIFSVLK